VAGPPALRVELLGDFRVLADGRALARIPSPRQQQLVAFLVLHARGTPVQRQRIAAAFWPESTDSQALTNLRRELHHLRESFPELEALIDAGTRTLAWRDIRSHTVDLIDFQAAAERGLAGDRDALTQAARLYVGDLLIECVDEWIGGDRERLAGLARQVLTTLVRALEREGAFGEAIQYAQQLRRLDPLDEGVWCALMRCHARRGERAAALHLYQQCAAVLHKELGVQPGAPLRLLYREVLELDATAPAAAPERASVYPLVGRTTEWRSLLDAWAQADAGRARLLLLRGEAGIGKTRLAEELVDWCAQRGVMTLAARSYAGEGRLAYAPIADWLKAEALGPSLMKLAPAYLTDVARLRADILVSRPDVPAPGPELESWQRLRFFEAVAHAFRAATPLVLVLDDLQWADADTLDWLEYFLHSSGVARCLIVGTARSEEEADNRPLGRLLAHLARDDRLTAITLGPLDRAATGQLAGAVAGQSLDEDALARTFEQTEGLPLFIIERGRMAQAEASGADDRSLSRVQAVVAARLGLLSAGARSVAELAAAVGRDFQFDLLAQASDLEEDALVRALDELWHRQIVRAQDGSRWDFTHDRIREVAYGSIGPARRRLIHRRIAHAMELLSANRLDEVSASIAVHLDRGGQPVRAVDFLDRAAAVAARISANEEAIRCLMHALALLELLPAGRDRDRRELELRSRLSVVLNSARGYAAPEVEENLDRVFVLYRSSDRGEVPVRWLWVAFTLRFMLGDLKGTRELSEQALARSLADPSCRCEAHHAMAGALGAAGELERSREHFEASLAAYDEQHPQYSALGSDLGVFAQAWGAHILWLLGEDQAALADVQRAIARAERRDHAYSRTLAFTYASLLHQMRGDTPQVVDTAERVLALCGRYGFGYYDDCARVLIGWARGQERAAEGVVLIEAALARLDAARAQARRPYYLSLLAETCVLAGNQSRAEAILDDAIRMALERCDLWWLPALYLQRGRLQPQPLRDRTFERALEIARVQHSRSLEQRILAAVQASSL
jgi:predicted ATPase/DNA-binding SARP family transcriptional activator